eukprot:4635513-Alexandrium_andersonii.AAC.1
MAGGRLSPATSTLGILLRPKPREGAASTGLAAVMRLVNLLFRLLGRTEHRRRGPLHLVTAAPAVARGPPRLRRGRLPAGPFRALRRARATGR